ncbi:methyltransferase domain-containing protein [candidate division KSB1 bacterium]|nr:methyltransferase domain-containing protein [candidate division KSB1 bacterium]
MNLTTSCMFSLKQTVPQNSPPLFDGNWLLAIRPDGGQRHNLRDDYTYCGYIALYLFAAKYCRNRRVLEVGCGCGFGSYLLAHAAERVIALDVNAGDVSYAANRYRKTNLHFLTADARQTGLADDSFEAIVSFETFEHIPPLDAKNFLLELRRLLKPAGQLILSTPNRDVYNKISHTPGHVNEMTVDGWFDLLRILFPHCTPFYQRKGELEKQKRFHQLTACDRYKLRQWLPRGFLTWFRNRLAPDRAGSIDALLERLQVHPAVKLAELENAVIQLAICKKDT